MLFLSGCTKVGEKSSSICVIYFTAALLSLLLLACCILLVKKKEPWLTLLFSCVFIINSGYYALSISSTLEAALWANRVAYLGSILLPLSMLMIILNVSGAKKPKWLPYLLFAVALSVFSAAASQGILDIYYKEVSLGSYNGATILEKVYGPLHHLNLFYLLGYTAVTAFIAVRIAMKKRFLSNISIFVLVTSVFINIGVWLLEQFVRIDVELLSLSYIISETFLLCLFCITEEEKAKANDQKTSYEPAPVSDVSDATTMAVSAPAEPAEPDALELFTDGIARLTPTEKLIYGYYLEGKGTKEIMATLNITENTLKYHNKNIYSKLGVSSRKQLIEIAKKL